MTTRQQPVNGLNSTSATENLHRALDTHHAATIIHESRITIQGTSTAETNEGWHG